MSNSTRKKSEQLGMPFGTAGGKLRKSILFSLLKESGKNVCYQCGNPIESEDELSIEHKIPWLDSDNPKELFFSLDNIAFSHLKCNCASRRNTEESKRVRAQRIWSGDFGKVISNEMVYKVRELLKTHTRREVLSITGLSKTTIARIARKESYQNL